MNRDYLANRFLHETHAECHCCGMLLKTQFNEPLSTYFVMNKQGHFYCTQCDAIFEDGDERIYVPEED